MKRFAFATLLFSFSIFCGQLANSQSDYFAEDGIYAAMETHLCGQSIVNDIPKGRVHIFRQAGSTNCTDLGYSGTYDRLSPSLFLKVDSTYQYIDQDDIDYCLINPTKFSCPTYFNQSGDMIAEVGNRVDKAALFNVLSNKAFKFSWADLLVNSRNTIINMTIFDRDDRVFVRKSPLNLKSSQPK